MSEQCHVEAIEKTATAEELATSATAYLAIFGMGCPRCALRVRNSLLKIYGVSDADVDHIAGMGKVVFAPNLTTISDIIDAVSQAGGDGRHEYWAAPLTVSKLESEP